MSNELIEVLKKRLDAFQIEKIASRANRSYFTPNSNSMTFLLGLAWIEERGKD